jgi:imidazolonepropionase-like amidohydrolase
MNNLHQQDKAVTQVLPTNNAAWHWTKRLVRATRWLPSKYSLVLALLSGPLVSNGQQVDLAITNAHVLNVRTGHISALQTILVHQGQIVTIQRPGRVYVAVQTLDAHGRLVTPAFIDSHTHPMDVLGDYAKAPLILAPDSLATYRQRISDQYLPYGTTTIATMGQLETWVPALVEWQTQPKPNLVNVYVAGGALISKEKRTPYIAHTTVETPALARQQVLAYHQAGIHYLKLYYRLQEPEFRAAYQTATELGMRVYGHIGDSGPGYLKMSQALHIGLRNYEHLVTLANGVIISMPEKEAVEKQFRARFERMNTEARVLEFFLEQFRYIDEHKKPQMASLIHQLAKHKASISTTIQRIYEQFEPTFYTTPHDTDLTAEQQARCDENFAIFMKYVHQLAQAGVAIRLGSDGPNGGKVNVSELMILAKYKFSVADTFKIATYNGAKALGLEKDRGSVTKGQVADLLIWDKSPFENPANFTSALTIVKNGKVYKNTMLSQP